MIIFEKEKHIYYYKQDNTRLLTSVTSEIKTKSIASKESHWHYWALYKVLEERIPNFKQIKPSASPPLSWLESQANKFNALDIEQDILAKQQDWKQIGEQASIEGTEEHAIIENVIYNSETYKNPFTGKYVNVNKTLSIIQDSLKISSIDSLKELPDGLSPEQMLWHLFWAGTADQIYIETKGNTRYVDIIDLKFKSKFTMSNKFQNFLYPWNSLEESDLNRAALQVSFYAYMLEQNGFTPRYLGVIRNNKIVPLKYLKPHIITLIDTYLIPSEDMPVQDLSEEDHLL